VSVLEIEGLSACYGAVRALRGASLALEANETLAVVGPNGAGKTTLLYALLGVLRPTAGRVLLDGRDVTRSSPEAKTRAGLVLVPERRQLFATLSVRDNLLLGGYVHRRRRDLRADLERVFEVFPALAERGRQLAGSLSGGEQQMVAIGRALMTRPQVLALDEPSLGLAPLVVQAIAASLDALRRTDVALLVIEQNAALAMRLADRVALMERGTVIADGRPEELAEDERMRRAYLGVA